MNHGNSIVSGRRGHRRGGRQRGFEEVGGTYEGASVEVDQNFTELTTTKDSGGGSPTTFDTTGERVLIPRLTIANPVSSCEEANAAAGSVCTVANAYTAGPTPEIYIAAKKGAQDKAAALAETFQAMEGSADASVTFHFVGGALELSVAGSGDGVVTIEGDTSVTLVFEGKAEVAELSFIGWLEWDLVFEAEGRGKTVNSVLE